MIRFPKHRYLKAKADIQVMFENSFSKLGFAMSSSISL